MYYVIFFTYRVSYIIFIFVSRLKIYSYIDTNVFFNFEPIVFLLFIMNPQNNIDCHKCKHYYVTWEKHFPHGCSLMKLKSKRLPSILVFENSGIPCLMFTIKHQKNKIK